MQTVVRSMIIKIDLILDNIWYICNINEYVYYNLYSFFFCYVKKCVMIERFDQDRKIPSGEGD